METTIPHTIEEIVKNRKIRTSVARESHLWFFHIYFPHYITFETAEFQKEIFALTESNYQTIGIIAFRGSGKSTIINMSYPIWAIIGNKQKKFVLIIGQTQQQAKQHFKNLKRELENNEILKKDLGPFTAIEDEWNSFSIVLEKYGAKITIASVDQGIRGIRHNQHRPDLIIGDDLEDLAFVRFRENRDKLFNWFTGEVLGAGDINTQQILIGNMLHEDSLIMRMRDLIKEGRFSGTFRKYPLLDENGKCLWPGKFKTPNDIEKEKRRIGSESAWQREYLLHIINDAEKVILKEWIQYYNSVPPLDKEDPKYRYATISVDPAISERDSADYTAILTARVFGYGDKRKIYILPNPINKRMTFKDTVDTVCNIKNVLGASYAMRLYVEDVGYQRSLIEELKSNQCHVTPFSPQGGDKRSRLTAAAMLMESGQVLFPKTGCEELISQLLGFGVEKHDDLADAFSMMVIKIMEDKKCDNSKIWKLNEGAYRRNPLRDVFGDRFFNNFDYYKKY